MKRFFLISLFILGTMAAAHAQKAELTFIRVLTGFVYYVDGEQSKASVFSEHLATVPGAAEMFQQGRSLRVVANVIGIPGAILAGREVGTAIGKSISNQEEYDLLSSPVFYVGTGLMITGIIIEAVGGSKIRKSVKMYNSAPNPIAFEVGPSERGLGVCLTF